MKISLFDFIKQRKDELDKFAQDWLSNAEVNPVDWPLFLDRQEWDEQELMTILPEEED
jgi:hypothetical protein